MYSRVLGGHDDPSFITDDGHDGDDQPSMFLTQPSESLAKGNAAPSGGAPEAGSNDGGDGGGADGGLAAAELRGGDDAIARPRGPTTGTGDASATPVSSVPHAALLLFGGESAMQAPQSWLSSTMPGGHLTVDSTVAAATGFAGTPASPLGVGPAAVHLPGPVIDTDVDALDGPPMGVVALRETSGGQVLPPEIFLTPAALPALRPYPSSIAGATEVRGVCLP